MLNNCFVWAHWQHVRACCEWECAGHPVDWEPVLIRRPSRRFPRLVGHWVTARRNPWTGELRDEASFVPDHPVDVPWYLAWTRLLFPGHIKHGDVPSKH